MESLVLCAFGEEEFLTALAMACSEAFFNNLLIRTQPRSSKTCVIFRFLLLFVTAA
jgi:hypothetical protein